ncbi:uncharacterized protein LOC132648570 [Meriones unguiculatus]|uniref:uncharacterized protein LOC132648570 n=1 Tax=Meriones unguiculatus TaxID=10047 RepID=UPI00293E388E|nr:uncharacterized protein LOC132648570 [Meriones unguiculatus]
MLRESTKKGEGCEGRGSLAAAPSLSLHFGFPQLRLFPVFLRVRTGEELQPALPRGGERGTKEAEQSEEAGAPMPRGALPRRRPGCAGPAHPATLSPLLSAPFRAPPGRRGCSPHSCGGARVLRTSPRSRDPRATHRSSRSPATAPPPRATSPRRRRGVAAAGVWSSSRRRRRRRRRRRLRLPSREPTSSAAAVTGRSGRPGCPGARARVPAAPRRPLPRPAGRARALRPAWPPLLLGVTPASHPALGRLWRRAPSKTQPAPGSRELDSPCSLLAARLASSRPRVPGRPRRRSVGHTRSPELTARAPAQPRAAGHSPLAELARTSEPLSPSLPPLRVWALLLLSQPS